MCTGSVPMVCCRAIPLRSFCCSFSLPRSLVAQSFPSACSLSASARFAAFVCTLTAIRSLSTLSAPAWAYRFYWWSTAASSITNLVYLIRHDEYREWVSHSTYKVGIAGVKFSQWELIVLHTEKTIMMVQTHINYKFRSGLVYTSTKHEAESEVIVRRTDKSTSSTLSQFDSGFQCTRGTEILMVSSIQIPVLPLGCDALAQGIYLPDTARGTV